MLLFIALALTPPAVAPAAPAGPTSLQLPAVELDRLEIGSGRLGGERNTIAFSYAASGAARPVPWVRFDATFLDPRSNARTRRSTDSIACPQAATILRAAPVSATAASEAPDPSPSITLHASTYTLSGRLNDPDGPARDFTIAGRSPTPLGWWAQALITALDACWRNGS